MAPTRRKPYRVGLIGGGAIGRPVAEAILDGRAGDAALAAVLVRDVAKHREWADQRDVVVTADADAFFACDFDLLVEAAGHAAVRRYARRGLEKGADVLVTSIGAFTDDAFYDEIRALAAMKGCRLLLASGALPAVDWMQGASLAKVYSVTITQTKPVASWRGTPAEGRVDLDATQVRLVADPTATAMHTSIEFKGEAGEVSVEWRGVPSAGNPSTSADVPLSVIKAIRNLSSPVWFGV